MSDQNGTGAPIEGASVHEEVTPAEQWRSARKEGFVVQLPSGNVARVRRTMDMMALLKAGRLPNPLADVIRRSMTAGAKSFSLDPSTLKPEEIAEMYDFMDEIACKVMVEPRCEKPPVGDDRGTWEPSEGAISVVDLTEEDKAFLFSVAQGGTTDLESFRSQSAEALAGLQDEPRVSDEAVSTAGG